MTDPDNQTPESRFLMTRRTFIKASGTLPLAGLLNSKEVYADNSDILLTPIEITANSGPGFNPPFYSIPLNTNMVIPAPPTALLRSGLTAPVYQYRHLYLVNGAKIFAAAVMGDPLTVLTAFAEGLIHANEAAIRNQAAIYGTFTSWLANGGYQKVEGSGRYGLTPSNLGNITKLFGLYGARYWTEGFHLPVSSFKFYGSPLTTLSGIYYWLFGGGATTTMDVNAMNLNMRIRDFGPVFDILNNPAMGPGTYNIDAQFSFNMFDHGLSDVFTALVNGRVSGHIVGTLAIGDNSYTFNGKWTLNPDRFEAYQSVRPGTQEILTQFLAKIGTLGHMDYDIVFTGSKNVSFSGQRPGKYKAPTPPAPAFRSSTGGLSRRP